MRRFGRLMPQIAEWGNVTLAVRKASIGSTNKPEVAEFHSRFEGNVNGIVDELMKGSWSPQPYLRFVVRDPKLRTIHAAPFRDRVVHHALMNLAGRCLELGAVDASFACRVGRGNRAAVLHAAKCTRRFRYFLKLDVRRYFDSVHHGILIGLIHRRIKDRALVSLLERLVKSYQTTQDAGLPIGTLTSQYFANFYLDGFDHWVQETLRSPAYARYMDDLVLWHDDPAVLGGWLVEIADWLKSNRGLSLKNDSPIASCVPPTGLGTQKSESSLAILTRDRQGYEEIDVLARERSASGIQQVLPYGGPYALRCSDGLAFLGYRITPRGVLLSRASRRRFASRLASYELAVTEGRMKVAELQRRVDSLLAFTDVANCCEWRRKLLAALDCASALREGTCE